MSDIVIIGAGVVGCAIARELAINFPDKKIVVLEKLPDAGLETSSRNSGILHSGLQQNPKFLKSRLARRGSMLAAEYIKNRGLPIIENGMIIAISWQSIKKGLWRDIKSLLHLLWQAWKQKIKVKLKLRTPFGIFVPNVCVTDARAFTQSLKKDALEHGVEFFFENPVENIEILENVFLGDAFLIKTSKLIFIAKMLINSAGLCADDIARMAGYNYTIYFWRGEYYEIIGIDKGLVNCPIFPAMPPNSPSKGILVFPSTDGKILVGPNARPVPQKNYYEKDKTPPDIFLKAVQRFFPCIKKENLRWAYSGIRPKLTNDPKETDFIIKLERKNPHFINLIGIESPGLSAAMAIGKYVANLLK